MILYNRAASAWTKKERSLRNEKLKANGASETEEQRKERLLIRRENDRARRRTKKTTRGKENVVRNSALAILKILNRGDENELERKLRLEKVVTSKHLRLAMETEQERRARCSYHKTVEDGSYHIDQVGLGDRGRKKIKKRNGFDLNLIWI